MAKSGGRGADHSRGQPDAGLDSGHGGPAELAYNASNSHSGTAVKLSELQVGQGGTVRQVDDHSPADAIARRLRDLGFVAGEAVRLLARGPVGREPLLVQVGFTRFALRGSEAARVRVEVQPG
jgi:ferrous iron transport protein A